MAILLLAQGQDNLATLRVRPTQHGEPAVGARVRVDTLERSVGRDGVAVFRVSPGQRSVVVSRLGFRPDTQQVSLRAGVDSTIDVELGGEGVELAPIVASTRSERRVDDTPLRVEIIDEEEIAEKAAMTPGDIAMMLNETSGLRVATTSPSLGAANVRMHGLRGRYTLMLTDGLPLYGAQGSGLGLLQIPPLDLQRVEVIKGNASALYGAAALGGVVNLITRRPAALPTRELLLNQTTRDGTDAVLFASGPLARLRATTLISAHRQTMQDIDGDGWADLSGYRRLVVRPRVFFDATNRSMFVTAGYTGEDREGGTLPGLTAPDGQPYREGLATNRSDVGLVARALHGATVYSLRASGVEQRHEHSFGVVIERDAHQTTFGEVSIAIPGRRATLVTGAAFQRDLYRNQDVSRFDFDYRVPSAFWQIDLDAARWLVLSVSGRVDWHNVYDRMFNPQGSALVRFPAGWTARFSTGTGAIAPVPFIDEIDAIGLTPVTYYGPRRRERLYHTSIDAGGPVASPLGQIELGISAYALRLVDALALFIDENQSPPIRSIGHSVAFTDNAGIEALARIVRGSARVTATYAFTSATEWDPYGPTSSALGVPPPTRNTSLTPRHSAGVVGSLEREGVSRLGLEVYYVGHQTLDDNPYRSESPDYVIMGLLGERQFATSWGRTRVFLNAENLTNVRQTRFDPLVRPTRGPGGRWTTDAWTELSGATLNGGIRFVF